MKQNPWLGLASYDEQAVAQGYKFCGRERAINELYSIVDNNLLTTKTLSVEDWRPGEKQRFAFFTVQGTRKMQLMFANWMFPGGETSDAQMEAAAE